MPWLHWLTVVLATEALNLGFTIGALAFGALIAATAGAYCLGANAVPTFWVAYILTRPLRASLGDLLSQPRPNGGVGLGAIQASIIFLVAIVGLVTFLGTGPKGPTSLPKTANEA